MTFTTKTISNSSVTRATGDLLDNEQMQTLRVIVARSSNSEILYNVKYDIQPNETQKTITFSELTVNKDGEDFDFYAIANEAGFLKTNESLEGTSVNITDLYDRVLTGGFAVGAALPQTGYKKITVMPQTSGIQHEDMQLDFPAGKIQLTFVNETGKEVNLTNVKVPSVAPNRAYLFYHGQTPGGTLTGNVDFGSITVPSGTESAPTFSSEYRYIYPGAAGEGKYKLTATWGAKNFEELLMTKDAPNGISSIPRNRLVNIVVTLKSGGGFGVKCEVKDWEDVSYDYTLSDAGQFAITKPNAMEFTYDGIQKAIATQYSTESGASSRQATFTVEMTTPVGVRWMAHLTNAQDFEFVTDENHAAEGVGGSSPVTLLIRPTKAFDATGERPYTELYVTLGTAPDNKQRFVDPGDYCSSDGTSIPIVQVSATEGDALWSTSVEP
ncbi:putative uncharacterized protein [Bacteroides sp. CAG:598]|nr:putative uncharacterized protein [Bacteroides sp. CAG:598]